MGMQALKTWAATDDEENAMDDDHRHLWRQMIDHIAEAKLTGMNVLDYGCNQGGFLRLLHRMRPFEAGVGVDLAEASLAKAAAQTTAEPLSFYPVAMLDRYQGAFDIAFSHEVLYLLPDLAAHAALIKKALKPGGAYYAAIGCHTDNPQCRITALMIMPMRFLMPVLLSAPGHISLTATCR